MSDLTRHNGQWARYLEAGSALSRLYTEWCMARHGHGPIWPVYRRERVRIWRAHGLTYRAWNRRSRLLGRRRRAAL